MPGLDIFSSDAFSLTTLTERINKMDFQPGLIGSLGLFAEKGVTTTSIEVEEKNGTLRLIPTNPRGAPPFVQARDRRTVRLFKIPQIQKYDRVYADQVQNIRSFGSDTDTQTVQALVDELLAQMGAEVEMTIEHLRVGALQGNILDSDGSTVIYNLFTEFGVSQLTAAITFSSAATEIRNQLVAAKRLIEADLGGVPVTGYAAIVSPEFFDALVAHATVKEAYKYQQGNQLQADLRESGFVYAGISFREYRGSIGATPYIAASTGYMYPTGPNLFATYFAPGDFVETVNTIGLPMYSKTAPDPEFNRWVSILVQSNPLPLALRPRSILKLTMN